jgi:predicted peptidase
MSRQQAHTLSIDGVDRLNYLLYLPENIDANSAVKWPLILFLHGRGERGSDVEKIKAHGIPKIVEGRADFPFIALSPQCPGESWWTMELEALTILLDEIINHYPVDTARIYLTGLSMGGQGTWELAMRQPDRFAAIAPICGWGEADRIDLIKHIPAWIFHGEQDELVPVQASQIMAEALQAAGGDVRLTLYPEAGHDSWTVTYNNPELYQWFLQHTRK